MSLIRCLLLLAVTISATGAQSQDASSRTSPARRPDVALVPASYRISPSDKLAVSVFDEPELSAEVDVSGGGVITLPLIETVKVSGLTLREAEQRIESDYRSEQFLRNPQVTVTIAAYARKTVSVLGQVGKPGQVEIPPGQSKIDLLAAIASAGDFKGIANKKKVSITRNYGTPRQRTIVVNVYDLMKARRGESTVDLYAGDVVSVPRRIL